MAALNLCPPARPFLRQPPDGGVAPPTPGAARPTLRTTSLLGLRDPAADDGGGGDQILLPAAFSRRGVVCLVTRTAPVSTSRPPFPPFPPPRPPGTATLRGFGLILTLTAPVSTSLRLFPPRLPGVLAGDRGTAPGCPLLRCGVSLLPMPPAAPVFAFVFRPVGLVASAPPPPSYVKQSSSTGANVTAFRFRRSGADVDGAGVSPSAIVIVSIIPVTVSIAPIDSIRLPLHPAFVPPLAYGLR